MPFSGSSYHFVSRKVQITMNNSGTYPATLSLSVTDSNYTQVGICNPTSSLTCSVFGPGSVFDSSYWMPYSFPFTWTGNTSSSGGSTGNCSGGSFTVYYRWLINNVETKGSFLLTIPSCSISVVYVAGNQSSAMFYYPDQLISVSAGSLSISAPITPSSLARKEVMLCLQNTGTSDILINWGNKFLRLSPGLNTVRYDGEVDSQGLPNVKPSGFLGTALSAGGVNYVVGVIGSSGTGGAVWGPAPLLPPISPSGLASQLSIRTDAGLGATVNLLNSSGITTTGITGSSVPQTASNTSGIGAVISDPTQSKPTQGIGNTTINTTNNTTNNSTVITTNTSAASSDPTSDTSLLSAIKSNNSSLDAMKGDGLILSDSSGVPLGDLVSSVGTLKASVADKFGSFGNILAVQSFGKATGYNFSTSLGKLGQFNCYLDFTKQPIPFIRALLLACMTMLFGVAFMKRVTI